MSASRLIFPSTGYAVRKHIVLSIREIPRCMTECEWECSITGRIDRSRTMSTPCQRDASRPKTSSHIHTMSASRLIFPSTGYAVRKHIVLSIREIPRCMTECEWECSITGRIDRSRTVSTPCQRDASRPKTSSHIPTMSASRLIFPSTGYAVRKHQCSRYGRSRDV